MVVIHFEDHEMSEFESRFDPEVREIRRLEVINGALGRRSWSSEEKGRIVAESMAPGVVVSEVARRHGLNPQQLFSWRHDAKQGRLVLPADAVSFVPVVTRNDDESLSPTSSMGQIEVHIGGAVVKVPDDAEPKHLSKVLRAVKLAL